MRAFFDPQNQLARQINRIARGTDGFRRMSIDHAATIMRYVRKVIEATPDGSIRFSRAKFFADWMLHNSLNNPIALKLIQQVNTGETDGLSIPLDFLVPHLLALREARLEISDILRESAASDDLVQVRSLALRFFGLILESVAETPIGFTDGFEEGPAAKRIRAAIREHAASKYGADGDAFVPHFHSLTIQLPEDDSDEFLWRLDFAWPDGAVTGVRGILLHLDGGPFKVEDIPLMKNPTREDRSRAIDRVFEKNAGIERFVTVREPKGQE